MSDNLNQEVANAIILEITQNTLLRAVEIAKLKEKLHFSVLREEDWRLYIENAIESETKASEEAAK